MSNTDSKRRKPSRVRLADPHYERECAKYPYPLPSREYTLDMLDAAGVPQTFDELVAVLDIVPDEFEHFQRRLGAMERDGQLMRNRRGAYIVPEKADLIRGRVQGHPDGFGFLVPDEGGADLFLGPKQMQKVLHGDRVMARIIGTDRRGRPEGAIVEVLERANTEVVGRVLIEHGVVVVVPEDKRISLDILIPPPEKGSREPRPQAGQVVMVEIIEQPARNLQPIGRIKAVLGNYADPGMEIEIALRKHALPFAFSTETEAEARRIPSAVGKGDLAGREDLRSLPLVTIDGETARDFDDAVYCERQGKGRSSGWRLVVAIADVSHYVKPGMALDRDALERGNSVYFPRRVIPMLPEALSNGICSLNPDVERLAMVCDMAISAAGEIKRYRFYPAVFRSHARLTYNQVWSWLSGDEPQDSSQRALLPHLHDLYDLFKALLKARWRRGAIDFETTETMMVFNEQGKIDNIVPVVRNDAHRLIEECMLAANVCASDFLQEHEHPALYRVHEGPTPEKLDVLRGFLAEFGFDLGGGDEPHAKDYAALLEKIKGRPDTQLLQTVLLRSLKQAVYSPENVGHFGLAYESYTHFTSPIRRYPDLLVHRAIKAVLAGRQYRPEGKWTEVGERCSMTERRADEATREVESWLKCYYMRDRIGERFTGTVSGVAGFGIFVALDGVYVEGMVHISELGSDYFHFDSSRHCLTGERTGQRFRLGDRVGIELVRADLETGRIDFVLSAEQPRPAAGAARKGGAAKQGEPVKQAGKIGKAGKQPERREEKPAKKTAAKKQPEKASQERRAPKKTADESRSRAPKATGATKAAKATRTSDRAGRQAAAEAPAPKAPARKSAMGVAASAAKAAVNAVVRAVRAASGKAARATRATKDDDAEKTAPEKKSRRGKGKQD